MQRTNALQGLAAASLLLLFALSALHCGGKVIGVGGKGGAGGSAGSGGGRGSGSGGSAGSGGGSCPVSHGPGPVIVSIGDPCDWGSASCMVAVSAGCGPGSFEDSTCVCTGSAIVCPSFVPPPCVSPVCPPPMDVKPGAACAGNLTCMSAIPETDCTGKVTGYASCTCDPVATWSCAISTPGCPPPPPPPPPPTMCTGPCAPGTTCMAPGAGACGSTRVFTCLSDGTYDPGIDPCSGSESCSSSTSCGEETCFCYESTAYTGHFVCKGGCDGGF